MSELCQCNEKPSFSLSRNSCPVVFCRKGVLRNFAKFTCKHLCQSLFFNKMQDLGQQLYLKKRLWHRCFPFEFCQIYNNIILYRTPPVVASAFHVIRYLSPTFDRFYYEKLVLIVCNLKECVISLQRKSTIIEIWQSIGSIYDFLISQKTISLAEIGLTKPFSLIDLSYGAISTKSYMLTVHGTFLIPSVSSFSS